MIDLLIRTSTLPPNESRLEKLFLSSNIREVMHHVLDITDKFEFDAIGGTGLEISPLIGALLSQNHKRRGFIIKKEGNVIGSVHKNDKVIIIDGITITGNNLIKCINIIEKYNCHVIHVITIINIMEDLEKRLKDISFDALVNYKDIINAKLV